MNISTQSRGATEFNEKILNIKIKFFSALDDFKKYYVYYNKNPEVNEFQNFYANSKGQLQAMSSEIFTTTSSIDKKINDYEDKINKLVTKIQEEKKLNTELNVKLKDIVNVHSSSGILIDDSKEEYNAQYYSNINLLIGILIISGLLFGIGKTRSQSLIK